MSRLTLALFSVTLAFAAPVSALAKPQAAPAQSDAYAQADISLPGVWEGYLTPGGNTEVPFTIRFNAAETSNKLNGTWGADPAAPDSQEGKNWGPLLDVTRTEYGVVFIIQADPSPLTFDMKFDGNVLQGDVPVGKNAPAMKARFEKSPG